MVAAHYADLRIRSMGGASEGRELWGYYVPCNVLAENALHSPDCGDALSDFSECAQRICGLRGLSSYMCGQSAMMVERPN